MLRLVCARVLLGAVLLLAIGGRESHADVLKPWNIIATEGRFVVLDSFSGNAVLDRRTNLIWEKNAHGSSFGSAWANAVRSCHDTNLSGHFGWRLPKIEELMTLLSANEDGVHSPNPFTDVTTATNTFYWSSSEIPTDTGSGSTDAFGVAFGITGVAPHPKTNLGKVWCVLGGAN
jgi:hypothetical protein